MAGHIGRQLGTIIKYSLIMELRGKVSGNPGRRSYRVLMSLAMVYLMSGIFLSIMTIGIPDSFTSSFVVSTFFMVLIGSFVLLEYPNLVTGPEDFLFYAPRPVSSATYFTGKVLSVLVIVSLFYGFFMLPFTIINLMYRRPLPLLAGNFLGIYLSGVIMALLIINLYGLLVKVVPYRVIRSVASLIQLITILGVYTINILVTRFIRSGVLEFRFELQSWILLIPSTWGNALFRLGTDPLAPWVFLLGLGMIPLLLFLGRRFISVTYAEKIADFALRSDQRRSHGRTRSLIWRSPEGFAVSRIIINQFKYNPQFRMGLLAIIPVTVIYFVIALFSYNASILDPFTPAGRAAFSGTFILYVAIGFFPVYIKNALSFSSEAEASWIFFTSPASRLAIVSACRRFILVFFLFPYLAVFALVFTLFTGALWHTLLHFLVITLLALSLTNYFIFFLAEIPFARSIQKGRRTLQIFLRMALAFLLPALVTVVVLFAYGNWGTYLLAVGILGGLYLLSEWGGRKVARRRLERQEFLE